MYYVNPPSVPDAFCQIGNQFTYTFQMGSFQDFSIDLINYKYAYKEFMDITCPLSTYNATFELLNSLSVDEETITGFETG